VSKFFRKAVASPMIDVISDTTFEYSTASELTYGGFDALLTFDWVSVPERENIRRKHDTTLALRFVI
jgi:polypeptide N-acetylgalactosaminyltransferase